MDIGVLQERPFLTGLLLGLVVWIFGATANAGAGLVALLLFAFGVVMAIYAEGWHRPAGQAFAGAGATVVLIEVLNNLLRGM